jgi:hypothetical protein
MQTIQMTLQEYLVEMSFAPLASLPSPQEMASFNERFIQPTLSACKDFLDAGKIAAGGPALAAVGLIFIARAHSPQDLEDMLSTLPLWPRAQTRVVPLGTFENRLRFARDRLQKAKASLAADKLEPAATT